MDNFFADVVQPLPDTDAARNAEAQRFDFLHDEASEPAFRAAMDHICELARTLLGVDCAAVTLLFEDDQIFVGRANLSYVRAARQVSFSGHTLASGLPFLIPDTTKDDRFKSNPFVTGPDHWRCYAGFPINLRPGIRIGALAAYHTEPRTLEPREVYAMELLTELAADKFRALLRQREVRAQSAILRQTQEFAHIGSWELDVPANHLVWSQQMYRIHEIEEGAEVTPNMLATLYAGETGDTLGRALLDTIEKGGRFEVEVSFFTALGNLRHGVCVGEVDLASGQRVLGTMYDVTSRHEAAAKLAAASLYDALTGLPNRVLFERRLAELTEGEDGADGSIVVVGLDDFQAEIRTRDLGNRVLREAAYRLVAAVGSNHVVARLGDHAFAVYLHGASTCSALDRHVSAIQRAFDEPFGVAEQEVVVTASLGIAPLALGAEAASALSGAEIALHQAKLQGPHGVETFAPQLRQERERHLALIAEVRAGIARNEFVLHYQPICEPCGRARGFEALMRWAHPTRGLLGPYHFMAAFADPDLSVALGDVALREAAKQMAAWRNQSLDFGYVSVNLSTAQFAKPDFVGEVASLLRVHGIRPSALVLEVTETVYLDARAAQILEVLRGFRKAGISLALDDFGTGHASLTHLKQFPIDRIKIDQSFVRELGESTGDAAIVRAIVSLGQNLGMQVIAEGVETAHQLEFLRSLGCDRIQGYYFAKPMPAHEAAAFCVASAVTAALPVTAERTAIHFTVPESRSMPVSSRPITRRRYTSWSSPPSR